MKKFPLIVQVWRQPARLATLAIAEWDLLLRQADGADLGAALFYLAQQQAVLDRLPTAIQDRLGWSRTLAERHVSAVRWEVNRIAIALADTGVPLILLKGAAYTMASRMCSPGRLYSDIDVLVPKARIDDVELALMTHGWRIDGYDAYDQRYYREWMHEIPPMQHMRRETTIDVHHAILPLTARVRPDPDKLHAAAVAVPGAAGLHVLAPADMVLHNVVHLFYSEEFRHGMRDLVDFDRLVQEFGADPDFWRLLPVRAAELQLMRPLFYALRYAATMLGTAVPPSVTAAVSPARPNGALLSLMDWLFHRTLLPQHASCEGRGSGTARFLLYVRGNWLRMPPLMLARHLFHKAFISPNAKPTE